MEGTDPLKLILKILEDYQICDECLGRQFASLGTNMTNTERTNSLLNTIVMQLDSELKKQNDTLDDGKRAEIIGKLKKIAKNSQNNAARSVLNNLKISFEEAEGEEFQCFLCNNQFLHLDKIVEEILSQTKDYEFSNFLMGTEIHPAITENEDEFRAKLNISTGESFKRNLNRTIGLKLLDSCESWDKEVEFDHPQMNIIIVLRPSEFRLKLIINPLCVKGRYHKFERGIPQTHWPHRDCHGRGCEKCNFTGSQYPTSVEELLSPYIQKYANGTKSKFHGAGREDIDARCLGTGRPFIIEIKEPHIRTFDLKKVEQEIKDEIGKRVDAINLEFVPRTQIKVIKGKGEATQKRYSALVESSEPISKEQFLISLEKAKTQIIPNILYQRTPIRVAHRRADLTREKRVYSISAEWIDETHSQFEISAMGGTYIKELISGDDGRTMPSLTSIFEVQLVCKELDVVAIDVIKA